MLNCKIHPVLYKFYLQLRKALGAEIVHRRKRTSNMCIEIIFHSENLLSLEGGHLNTLPEAEQCGYFVICRPQTKRGHTFYKGHRVYQLFLSPVHPKKRRESLPRITPLSASINDSSAATMG
ncbi:MAG: hypothetical protein II644_07715 [Paludibacteraceae bacterium]|nr:hypothetical protein [Paludibacteraceae bacterium]